MLMEPSAEIDGMTLRASHTVGTSEGHRGAAVEHEHLRHLIGTVRSAQAGDAEAFADLADEFGPGALRFLALRLHNDADARDALQETLVAAWRSLPRLRKPQRFGAWFLGIAVHKANDLARTRRREDTLRVPADIGRDQFAMFELREAIDSLPENLRDVILLRYLLSLPERETARVLGIRVGTVKSRASRARTMLARLLSEPNDEASDLGGAS